MILIYLYIYIYITYTRLFGTFLNILIGVLRSFLLNDLTWLGWLFHGGLRFDFVCNLKLEPTCDCMNLGERKILYMYVHTSNYNSTHHQTPNNFFFSLTTDIIFHNSPCALQIGQSPKVSEIWSNVMLHWSTASFHDQTSICMRNIVF